MARMRKWIPWLVVALVAGSVLVVVFLVSNPVGSSATRGSSSPPPPTMTLRQWDAGASNDTYADVVARPGQTYGDYITWTCNLANSFGQDTPDGKTNIGCWEYTGTYQGDNGDGEIILSIPSSIDTGSMRIGDRMVVRGTVGHPYVHTRRRAADSGPTVDVVFLTDQGHDNNAT
jgi:hypothetical protein